MKPKQIKSKKMRDSARGEECTLQIAGVCNGNAETVVLCHFPDESHGIGTKADDISAGYGCSACHDAIDRRSISTLTPTSVERQFYMRRSQTRTLRRMIEKEVICIK